MTTVIYHNPRCSKSRATLDLLRENGVEPEIVEYLKTPPTKSALSRLSRLLNVKPAAMMRLKEAVAKELNLDAADPRSDDEWFDLIANNPVLLERPIVVVDDNRAAIGRPPENVLALIRPTAE